MFLRGVYQMLHLCLAVPPSLPVEQIQAMGDEPPILSPPGFPQRNHVWRHHLSYLHRSVSTGMFQRMNNNRVQRVRVDVQHRIAVDSAC